MILLIVFAILFALASSLTYRNNNKFALSQSIALGATAYFHMAQLAIHDFQFIIMWSVALSGINFFLNLTAFCVLFLFNDRHKATYWIALALYLLANAASVIIYNQHL